jgi:hypothetical protein
MFDDFWIIGLMTAGLIIMFFLLYMLRELWRERPPQSLPKRED